MARWLLLTCGTVKLIPGTLQGGGAQFTSTHWSLVVAATDARSQVAERALADLCRHYWPPIYTFVRRRGHQACEAQDLTQAFFVHVLEKRLYGRADPARGRFRTFLLATLKHFLADAHAQEQALKRGGGREFLALSEKVFAAESEAFLVSDGADGTLPSDAADRLFEARWAAALLGRALETLRSAYDAEGRENLFRVLRPFLGGGNTPPPDHQELAARLGLPINTLRTHIHRLRERYRTALRAEVADTVVAESDVQDELRHLLRVMIDQP